ncbi:hypothetical protein KKB99_08760, partial [bacterium]|nr:hypothetical protein [bacterium]MBU1026082.1 hypothetical protein [bacterium]
MKYKPGVIACFLLSFSFVIGCSSSGTPTTPEASPKLTGEGHVILMSGTMVIDTINMEVRQLEYQVDPIHNSIFDLLTDYLKVEIVEAKADQVTLRIELENPYESQLFDMRIIFTDLNDKTVINHDGFTNFFSSLWNQDYNPFITFSKDTPNHAFPVGPGGQASENVMLSWFDGVNQNVSYIIECSLDKNTEEPYAVSGVATFGDMTPQGGSMIVKCEIGDWQDDIDSVKILANGFNEDETRMYRYRDTNIYGGSLVNLRDIQPGDHVIWIQVESVNSESLILRYPVNIKVPDTLSHAPAFGGEPFVDLFYSEEEGIKNIKAWLHGGV